MNRQRPGTDRTRTGSWFWRDIRFAIRRLVRSPGFTFTAVAILGLGIGANTAVFSIIDAVYLDDPPHIVDPDRLVRIYGVDDRAGTPVSLPYSDFAHHDENQRSFDGLKSEKTRDFAERRGTLREFPGLVTGDSPERILLIKISEGDPVQTITERDRHERNHHQER